MAVASSAPARSRTRSPELAPPRRASGHGGGRPVPARVPDRPAAPPTIASILRARRGSRGASRSAERAERLRDPADALLDVGHRRGVRQAHEARGAEAGARYHGDLADLDEPVAEL